MSITASRQLFSRLLSANSKKYMKCLANVRFKSDQADKKDNEIKVSGKIEHAVLKKFSEPLQIESVDPPKRLQSTEVRSFLFAF